MKKTFLLLLALVPLLSTAPAFAAPAFVSEYSSIAHKDCKIVKSGVGYDISQCPSHDGYGVVVTDDEGASSVILNVKGKEVLLTADAVKPDPPLQFQLPYVAGEKLEWRYETAAGKKRLAGVIFRVGDQSWDEKQTVLFVTRVNGDAFCPLGVAKTNEAAQKLVDGGKGCLVAKP
jgi:hypothetical protein